jgi:Na+/H+-dicarboxylate symporter
VSGTTSSGRRWPSLTTLIFLGIGLGILVGLFLGELAAPLSIVGTAFVRLLQMTVLPYVFVSLVIGLGRQQPAEARAIARSGGLWLLVLWGIALFMALLVPIAFPDWESASFFSDSLVEPDKGIDFLGLYIPANPFHALADNLVPAVVVFSICFGVALIGLPGGSTFLDALTGANDALTRIANAVVSLTPIGVFGIAANAAGTISLTEFGQLQVFIAAYVVTALFMTFWVIPGLLSAMTPLSHRAVIRVSRDALITAFATGSVFVVLPILANRARTLMADAGTSSEESGGVIDVVLPASYSFPTAGTILALSFVLFAGWFTGSSVAPSQYPQFAFAGLFSLFGGTIVAIPFLLDQMRISADTFDLYLIVSQVITTRFNSLLAAMHILGLTLLTATVITGGLEVRWHRILRFAGVTLGGALALLFGVRMLFTYAVHFEYQQYDVLVEMEIRGPTVTVRDSGDAPIGPRASMAEGSALDRMRERGVLRVGYIGDRLPYAYLNATNRVVGFDAEMMHLLAFELGLELEFIRIEASDLAAQLASGSVDIVACGTVVTTERLLEVFFSEPYSRSTLAFLVEDHRRASFSSAKALRQLASPTIGVPQIPYLIRYLERNYPHAKLVPIDNLRPFLRGQQTELDAVAFAAEAGSVWTLVYPDFAVAVPQPEVISIPMAYPVRLGDERMLEFLNHWLELKRQDGTLQRLKEYWIQGREPKGHSQRWSVIRDVLGWVD